MNKKTNLIEKKLKFYCSTCQTTWQLLIIRTDFNKETNCLNNCSQKWENLLIAYCQERQILYFVSQEQAKDKDLSETKDKQSTELAEMLEKLRKQNAKK